MLDVRGNTEGTTPSGKQKDTRSSGDMCSGFSSGNWYRSWTTKDRVRLPMGVQMRPTDQVACTKS